MHFNLAVDVELVVDIVVGVSVAGVPFVPAWRRRIGLAVVVQVLAVESGAVPGILQPGRDRGLLAFQAAKRQEAALGRPVAQYERVVGYCPRRIEARDGRQRGYGTKKLSKTVPSSSISSFTLGM